MTNLERLVQYVGLDPVYCSYRDIDNKFLGIMATELYVNGRLSKRQEEVVYNILIGIGKLCSIYEEMKMDRVYRAMDILKELGIAEGMRYKGKEYQELVDAVVLLVASRLEHKITLQLVVDVVNVRD